MQNNSFSNPSRALNREIPNTQITAKSISTFQSNNSSKTITTPSADKTNSAHYTYYTIARAHISLLIFPRAHDPGPLHPACLHTRTPLYSPDLRVRKYLWATNPFYLGPDLFALVKYDYSTGARVHARSVRGYKFPIDVREGQKFAYTRAFFAPVYFYFYDSSSGDGI